MNILVFTWLIPMLLSAVSMATSIRSKSFRTILCWLPVIAIMPALWAAMAPSEPVHLPWLLFGSDFGLDGIEHLFLLANALVWLAASLYLALSHSITDHQHRFVTLLLLAMAGSLMLLLARDVASFYLGFTMMSLSTYGLVIQQGSHKAIFAGKVYMILALAGELALFAAVLMFLQRNGMALPAMTELLAFNADANAPMLPEQGLYIIGFGIKGGLLGLHIWLPLAHPAAPAGASAVLSGVMLKAALIGFIRFMPMGTEQALQAGQLLLWGGLSGAIIGAIVAICQSSSKILLAWSSITKMGLAFALIGVMLTTPASVPVLLPLLGFFALYHGLAKAAMFLTVGWLNNQSAKAAPWIASALLIFAAISLSGLPMGAGGAMKTQIQSGLSVIGGQQAAPDLATILQISPLLLVLTLLLITKLIYLVSRHSAPTSIPCPVQPKMALIPVIALVLLGLLLPTLNLIYQPITAGF